MGYSLALLPEKERERGERNNTSALYYKTISGNFVVQSFRFLFFPENGRTGGIINAADNRTPKISSIAPTTVALEIQSGIAFYLIIRMNAMIV